MANPAKWFLPFDAHGGDGRPWGDGTSIAARAAHGLDPWDEQCEVTPLIGGWAAMSAIRDALEQTIADAHASGLPPGQCGHVYLAGWRLNAQRDLSDNTTPWHLPQTVPVDRTPLGLVLALMKAGVRVRIMLWLPTMIQDIAVAGPAHVADHYLMAHAVGDYSKQLGGAAPLGVVALDARTAEGSIAGTHHQKTIVIRGLGGNDVAFCGGVDLAFTRRDSPSVAPAPAGAAFLQGDWQSTAGIPEPQPIPNAPRTAIAADYPPFPPSADFQWPTPPKQASDLPEADAGLNIYGFSNQIWHDQHLKLRGPIVQTLEDQFAERWKDSADLYDLSDPGHTFGGQVIFSTPDAFDEHGVVPLPLSATAAPPAGAASAVQMLRTIPWRDARTGEPFQRAEFTVMGAISHAVAKAEHLVWIFDQYFWSMPLARQLNFELTRTGAAAKPDLRVIVVLPPYADSQPAIIHEARRRALEALCDGARAKVEIYGLWDYRGGRGIYCHAKTQTYDGGMLICGSANMNRRSFLCDSEIACAVADEAVVASHQEQLWSLLFCDVPGPDGQWPGLDLDAAGSGAAFLAAFAKAAQSPRAYLHRDQWELDPPKLPNGVILPRGNLLADAAIDRLFDPTSVDPEPIERLVDYREGTALRSRPARLDDVVKRLEATVVVGGETTMPNRRQSSEFRLPLIEVDPNFGDVGI